MQFSTKQPPHTTNHTGIGGSFLSLPPEIRLAMYRNLFCSPSPILLCGASAIHLGIPRSSFCFPGQFAALPFLRTCRTIHSEAAPIFYRENEWRYYDGEHRDLWYKHIGEKNKNLAKKPEKWNIKLAASHPKPGDWCLRFVFEENKRMYPVLLKTPTHDFTLPVQYTIPEELREALRELLMQTYQDQSRREFARRSARVIETYYALEG